MDKEPKWGMWKRKGSEKQRIIQKTNLEGEITGTERDFRYILRLELNGEQRHTLKVKQKENDTENNKMMGKGILKVKNLTMH